MLLPLSHGFAVVGCVLTALCFLPVATPVDIGPAVAPRKLKMRPHSDLRWAAYDVRSSTWPLTGPPPPVPKVTLQDIRRDGPRTAWANIVQVKMFKCMSSTVGGVVRRIGLRAGLAGVFSGTWSSQEPLIWANHMRRSELQRNLAALTKPTFVFTTVREPAARCLSRYYFGLNAKMTGPLTDKNGVLRMPAGQKVDALKRCEDTMSIYLHPKAKANAAGVLSNYDFIGSAERPDETFVLLYYLLRDTPINATILDMLFISSKNSSTPIRSSMSAELRSQLTDTVKFARDQVAHPSLREEPQVVQRYVRNNFAAHNRQDILLLYMVHRRMDQLIASIPDFQKTLAHYRSLMAAVRDQCPTMTLPCIYKDAACSQNCINHLARAHGDGARPRLNAPLNVHL